MIHLYFYYTPFIHLNIDEFVNNCYLPTCTYFIKTSLKIRVQFQFRKFIIRHDLELAEGTVRQLHQLCFFCRKFTAHLIQAFDQPCAAAGIINAHQVHFLKSEVSHIKSPFPRSFFALSFCVLVLAGSSADLRWTFSFPVPRDE